MNKLLAALLGLGILFIVFTFSYQPQPDIAFQPVQADFSSPELDQEPLQTEPGNPQPFDFKDYRITPLADFQLKARVLSTKSYWLGREADLSPLDFALGWGAMADPGVLETISIRQSNRWYYWQTPEYPIPRHQIESSSANMHLIPADDAIAKKLATVDTGNTVFISGQLVRVDAEDNWRWVSSLSRTDTGDGACELIYVTQVFSND